MKVDIPLWMGQYNYIISGLIDTRKHLVPALVTHLIAYMNLNMVQANHQQDDKGNQEVINCVGQLLSCLSNHEIERLVIMRGERYNYLFLSLL